MTTEQRQQRRNRAAIKLVRAIGKQSNAVGTDVEVVEAYRVERKFVQGSTGIHITLDISDNLLDKLDKAGQEAIKGLLNQ